MDLIGKQFELRGKRKDIATVIDILTTRNLAGEIVRKEYVYEYNFLGQKIKGICPQSTIKINLINRS